PDEIADEARPCRRVQRMAQVRVQHLLHDDADTCADGEEEREDEFEHLHPGLFDFRLCILGQQDEGSTMKIYMAGPLFSTAELAFNAELARQLRGLGHEVFLPQEHEQRKDMPAAIFESDLRGLDWAEVVVASLDGPDPDSGTCWELGYAYGKAKPSI